MARIMAAFSPRFFSCSITCAQKHRGSAAPKFFVIRGDKVLIQQLARLRAPFVLKGDNVLIRLLAHLRAPFLLKGDNALIQQLAHLRAPFVLCAKRGQGAHSTARPPACPLCA